MSWKEHYVAVWSRLCINQISFQSYISHCVRHGLSDYNDSTWKQHQHPSVCCTVSAVAARIVLTWEPRSRFQLLFAEQKKFYLLLFLLLLCYSFRNFPLNGPHVTAVWMLQGFFQLPPPCILTTRGAFYALQFRLIVHFSHMRCLLTLNPQQNSACASSMTVLSQQWKASKWLCSITYELMKNNPEWSEILFCNLVAGVVFMCLTLCARLTEIIFLLIMHVPVDMIRTVQGSITT